MAPPKGNENALKHGRRVRSGLQIGGSPKGTGYITVALRHLRQSLETSVTATHGEITLTHSALINSACRWERVAALGTKWLRSEGDKLATLDRMNLVRSIAQASDSRDKCIRSLGIDAKSPADVWRQVYAAPLPAATPQGNGKPNHAVDAQDATDEAVANDTGNDEREGQG